MEYRIWTHISNAMYEVNTRVAEWIKKDGNKNDQRVWAAVKGLEAYTNGYIEEEKERLKGTEMEEKRGTRAYKVMETKLQEVAGPGIPAEELEQDLRAQLQTAEEKAYERVEAIHRV